MKPIKALTINKHEAQLRVYGVKATKEAVSKMSERPRTIKERPKTRVRF